MTLDPCVLEIVSFLSCTVCSIFFLLFPRQSHLHWSTLDPFLLKERTFLSSASLCKNFGWSKFLFIRGDCCALYFCCIIEWMNWMHHYYSPWSLEQAPTCPHPGYSNCSPPRCPALVHSAEYSIISVNIWCAARALAGLAGQVYNAWLFLDSADSLVCSWTEHKVLINSLYEKSPFAASDLFLAIQAPALDADTIDLIHHTDIQLSGILSGVVLKTYVSLPRLLAYRYWQYLDIGKSHQNCMIHTNAPQKLAQSCL